QASLQIKGTVAGIAAVAAVADPGGFAAVAWSYAGSNFSFGNLVDPIAPSASRLHKTVRRQPALDRQKPATRSLICKSEIFAATRYIPDCRSSVSRNGVVCNLSFFQAATTARRPG